MQNELVQEAVIRNLEIIGEASNNIEKHYGAFAMEYSDLPFSYAYQMRNAVAHGYFKVDLEMVWRTIHSDLSNFYQKLIVHIDSADHGNTDFEP